MIITALGYDTIHFCPKWLKIFDFETMIPSIFTQPEEFVAACRREALRAERILLNGSKSLILRL